MSQFEVSGRSNLDLDGLAASATPEPIVIRIRGDGRQRHLRFVTKFQKRREKVVQQAHIIYGASAKNGIKQLVYALSGYDATREQIISAFKFYVQEEAREYEKEFPPNSIESGTGCTNFLNRSVTNLGSSCI